MSVPTNVGDSPFEWQSKLQQALAQFSSRPAQAANRMQPIQQLVKAELERRITALGALVEVRLEQSIKGKHRTKNWDLVLSYARRPQLAISTKSIMRNVSGTVPNRIDDAMGECVNAHAHDPGIVLGYLFVMDAASGQQPTRDGRTWASVLAESLASFSGRRSEYDAHELFEAATLLLVDFTRFPPNVSFHAGLLAWTDFFAVLLGQVRARNPMIDLVISRHAGESGEAGPPA